MKNMSIKKVSILALSVIAMSSCSNDSSGNGSGSVAFKASSASTPSGKSALTSAVVYNDFKINIGKIKLETDAEDQMHGSDPLHEDVKLNGPFLLDLMDPNQTLSQFITSVTVPNAKYEEIKFQFEKSTVAGEMFDKTFLIKGTINGKAFALWSTKNIEVKTDFDDNAKDFTIHGNNASIDIKLRLDALTAKLIDLDSQSLLIDLDGDGVIEISTDNEDGNHDLGDLLRELLENNTHLNDVD